MLQVRLLTVNYGLVRALTAVSLEVSRGEIVSLLGSNGAGKSTLLRAIVGLERAVVGNITFEEQPLDELSVEGRVRLGLAIILEGRGMLPRMTVYENLQMGAYLRSSARLHDDLDRIFSMFPVLRQRARQPAGTLSGGEQQMLAFGRALMLRPKMILMDEPSMGLAPVVVERVFDAIREINSDGTTVLLVEQNAVMALSIAHRFYVLRSGEMVLKGQVIGGKLQVDHGAEEATFLSEEDLERAYLEGA